MQIRITITTEKKTVISKLIYELTEFTIHNHFIEYLIYDFSLKKYVCYQLAKYYLTIWGYKGEGELRYIIFENHYQLFHNEINNWQTKRIIFGRDVSRVQIPYKIYDSINWRFIKKI